MRIAIFLVLLATSESAVAQSLSGAPFIAVHGRANVDVVPDTFPVSVSLSETSIETSKAQETVERLTVAVLAQVRALGVKDADISVGNVSIDPQSSYDQKAKKSVFLGNEYSREINVHFRSLTDVKAFIAAIPSGKQVEVSTDVFESSDVNEIRRKLLADAMIDARKTADVLAANMGQRIVRIQTVSDRPLSLSVGSYINAIDVSSVESTTILTAEQIAKIPVSRNITSVALLSPGTVKSEIVLEKGVVTLLTDVYVVYILGD
jgi:uncharacterized protein